VLRFKNRRRTLLRPGRFTELFFLDEATGLAAGHRPCGECRMADLRRFGACWPGRWPRGYALAREMDEVMKVERIARQSAARRQSLAPGRPPPDGTMFVLDAHPGRAILAAGSKLWAWTPFGYEGPLPWTKPEPARLLTPPSTAEAIANGYKPEIHPSALG